MNKAIIYYYFYMFPFFCICFSFVHLGYERVYLPLCKVVDTLFHIQRDDKQSYNLPVSIFSASVLVLSTLNRYLLIRHCIVSAYVVVFVSSVLADSNSRFMFSRRRCHKQTHHHHRISVGLQRVYSHSMTIVQNFLFICYSLIIIIC